MKARDAVMLLAETSLAACETGCAAQRLVVFDAAAKALAHVGAVRESIAAARTAAALRAATARQLEFRNFVRAALMEGGGCK